MAAQSFDSSIFRKMLEDIYNARMNRKPKPTSWVAVPSSEPGYVEFVRRDMVIDALPNRKELEA